MAVKSKQLAVMLEGRTGVSSPPVPYPRPSGVLYQPPNLDGSRKMCGNCCLWAERDQECLIHAVGMKVVGDMVCGYHVFGEPQLFGSSITRPPGVTPELSGLEATLGGGTSCDTCRYYEPAGEGSGDCVAVADPKSNRPPTEVEALGCCARWARGEGP